jgi:ribosomal protein S18 acetylase RimI-like enzyme
MQPLRVEDAHAVAELDMLLFPDNCLSWKTIETEIRHGEGFVVYDGEMLIAYLLARKDSTGLVDILRLGVRQGYQSRGLGSDMLLALFSRHNDVMLCVRKDNRAIRLYLRHGFEIVGQLEESWVMRLHLDRAEDVAASALVGAAL